MTFAGTKSSQILWWSRLAPWFFCGVGWCGSGSTWSGWGGSSDLGSQIWRVIASENLGSKTEEECSYSWGSLRCSWSMSDCRSFSESWIWATAPPFDRSGRYRHFENFGGADLLRICYYLDMIMVHFIYRTGPGTGPRSQIAFSGRWVDCWPKVAFWKCPKAGCGLITSGDHGWYFKTWECYGRYGDGVFKMC